MKLRAPRLKVMMDASFRSEADWAPGCIIDIGEGGLAMQAAEPPRRGAYIEVRRGTHSMIGRVAWANGRRFGIRTRDRIAVSALVGDEGGSEARARRQAAAAVAADWQADRRPHEQHAQRNQLVGRALQFGFVAMLGMSAAVVGFEVIRQELARPMSTVTAALEPPR